MATLQEQQPGSDGTWRNWSGSVAFDPARVERPATADELARVVRRARAQGRRVRPVGALHSSSGIIRATDVLVTLERMRGLARHDAARREATVRAGTRIGEAGRLLLARDLMMHNWGDVDYQTVVGAVMTGTHGSGIRLKNLATMLVGGRMVTGEGDVVEFSAEDDPDLTRSVRCSMGTLGILTDARLALVPAFRVRRQEWCTTFDGCMDQLDALAQRCYAVDFYWYPRSDEAKIRTSTRADEAEPPAVRDARLVKDQAGWGSEVVPQERLLKFDEMEYALPASAGPGALRELRERVKRVHRRDVGWRVLYRFVAADDAPLSTANGRDTVTISCHHNAGLPYEPYFRDVEPIFRERAGRPHWGKKHTLAARDLEPLYPEWTSFARRRARLDPDGVLLSPEARELLGVAP